MPTKTDTNDKRIYVTRPWGDHGPRLTTVQTKRVTAVFSGRTPVAVVTHFDPSESVTAPPEKGTDWWSNLTPMLMEELGESWFENQFVPVALAKQEPTPATVSRAKLLTVLSAWWTLTQMANSHATLDEFLQLVASRAPQAHFLFDELTTRLNTLAADALDQFPRAVLSLETAEFIEQLVSAMEEEGVQ